MLKRSGSFVLVLLFSCLFISNAWGVPGFTFLKQWGMRGDGDGQFQTISGITRDKFKIYVSDSNGYKVQAFDAANNSFIWKFSDGVVPGSYYPSAIARAKDFRSVWVIGPGDQTRPGLKQLSSDGAVLKEINVADNFSGVPNLLAIDPFTGNIYVGAASHSIPKLLVFNQNGNYLNELLLNGGGNSSMLAVTVVKGNIFILGADSSGNTFGKRIKKFTSEGAFVNEFVFTGNDLMGLTSNYDKDAANISIITMKRILEPNQLTKILEIKWRDTPIIYSESDLGHSYVGLAPSAIFYETQSRKLYLKDGNYIIKEFTRN